MTWRHLLSLTLITLASLSVCGTRLVCFLLATYHLIVLLRAGCLNLDFWTLGNEATIGYLRHAEIKHGRVAMAAFLGYLAQSTPVVSGPHAKLPYSGYEPGLTPPEQWDAIPLAGKIQIFGIIGMLESYGEILPQHYCDGGLPGYYPPIKGNRFELIFNLYDPFNWFDENKDKIRGRQVEINNGRLAMLGIFGIISESKVPGSVPLITGLIPEYKGDYMVLFQCLSEDNLLYVVQCVLLRWHHPDLLQLNCLLDYPLAALLSLSDSISVNIGPV